VMALPHGRQESKGTGPPEYTEMAIAQSDLGAFLARMRQFAAHGR
jgi:hypothetical protein